MNQAIFLGYQFTGVEELYLQQTIGRLHDIIKNSGNDVFCSLTLDDQFKEQGYSYEYIYRYCLEQQRLKKIFICVIEHPIRSTGIEMELKLAMELGQKRLLFIRNGLGDQILSYKDVKKRFCELYSYFDNVFKYRDFSCLIKDIQSRVTEGF